MSTLKQKLHQACLNYAQQRVRNAEEAMIEAQSSANEETKSTAGDKHDTSRAMMQIEVEQAGKHLAQAQQLLEQVKRININLKTDKIQPGSAVRTSSGNYFIAISTGKIDSEGEIWYAVSAVSPIGQALIGRNEGQTVTFNGKKIEILEVW